MTTIICIEEHKRIELRERGGGFRFKKEFFYSSSKLDLISEIKALHRIHIFFSYTSLMSAFALAFDQLFYSVFYFLFFFFNRFLIIFLFENPNPINRV